VEGGVELFDPAIIRVVHPYDVGVGGDTLARAVVALVCNGGQANCFSLDCVVTSFWRRRLTLGLGLDTGDEEVKRMLL
jgi:hypothetical protein